MSIVSRKQDDAETRAPLLAPVCRRKTWHAGQVMRYLDGVTPLPDELTPTDLSFHVLEMMQNKEFNMSYADLLTSFGTISDLSGGR